MKTGCKTEFPHYDPTNRVAESEYLFLPALWVANFVNSLSEFLQSYRMLTRLILTELLNGY